MFVGGRNADQGDVSANTSPASLAFKKSDERGTDSEFSPECSARAGEWGVTSQTPGERAESRTMGATRLAACGDCDEDLGRPWTLQHVTPGTRESSERFLI